MRFVARCLLNFPLHELWPAQLLRTRRSADARLLQRSCWVLRAKYSGAYVLGMDAQGNASALAPFHSTKTVLPALHTQIKRTLAQLHLQHGKPACAPQPCSLHTMQQLLQQLQIDADTYAQTHQLHPIAEPDWLAFAGNDCFGRTLWLHPNAARAWQHMQHRAWHDDGVRLLAISGYRSHAYQYGIIQRKLARGQSIAQILQVNTAPGFSEHHSGYALDIGTLDTPPAEQCFEHTRAFAWLQQNAAHFGFVMSYPRDNRHGIIYEPWHWAWQPH